MALDLVIPPQRICIRRWCSADLTRPHPSALRWLYDISPGGRRMLLRRRLRRPRLLRLLLRGCLRGCLLRWLRARCRAAADGAVPALWSSVCAGRGTGGGRGRSAAHVVDLDVPVGGVYLLVAKVRVRGDDVLRRGGPLVFTG